MSKGIKPPTPGESWRICDGCGKQTPPYTLSPLDGYLPAGWSHLEVVGKQPLEDNYGADFCNTCTDKLQLMGVTVDKLVRVEQQ